MKTEFVKESCLAWDPGKNGFPLRRACIPMHILINPTDTFFPLFFQLLSGRHLE